MGGDFAPREAVLGAIQAAREYGIGVLLVGPEATIRAEMAQHLTDGLDLEIVHTDEVIGMDEHPAEAIRAKKRNSMTLCHELVRDGQALGAVSAGNSGAVMAAALFTLRRIRGVDRPAFGGTFPAAGGKRTFVLDIGANTDSKPQWLVQFALMGSVYMRSVAGIGDPRVGLLANGEEETKGDQRTQEAHRLLAAVAPTAGINFVGNIEGRDVNAGTVDVVVCDGFVGNIVLKLSEGLGKMLLETIKRELTAGVISTLGAALAKPAFNRVRKQVDYEEYGGVPILGVNGVSIISHGSSKAKAIKNAIRVAFQAADAQLPQVIAEGMRQLGVVASTAPAASEAIDTP
ncbi:MAG: phosphate acyltransferase PlsX [Ktedonobacterales bacterium]|nr:phosphate acyltransferase PlsX [Ktedonobacterales bacterium]